jgi:hypothetical protein
VCTVRVSAESSSYLKGGKGCTGTCKGCEMLVYQYREWKWIAALHLKTWQYHISAIKHKDTYHTVENNISVFKGTFSRKHVWEIEIIPLNQCCGSGSEIRCFFTPWTRDPEQGWFFPDPGWVNFLALKLTGIRNEKMLRYRSGKKHPGSATLL